MTRTRRLQPGDVIVDGVGARYQVVARTSNGDDYGVRLRPLGPGPFWSLDHAADALASGYWRLDDAATNRQAKVERIVAEALRLYPAVGDETMAGIVTLALNLGEVL